MYCAVHCTYNLYTEGINLDCREACRDTLSARSTLLVWLMDILQEADADQL
jgi:hypothetical protein